MGCEYVFMFVGEGVSVVVNDFGGVCDGMGVGLVMVDEVVVEICDKGGWVVVNYDSVVIEDGVVNIIKIVFDEFGVVYGVVSNVGILCDGIFYKMLFENWDVVFKVYFYGGYYVLCVVWLYFCE